MIIRQLHVDGFGKLTNLNLTFYDDINLIYGDNEAGKSTLCSFIFYMLYGMERSRGKASRFDSYVRFKPWHSVSYGGTLTFEAEGATWFLERSFLSENRFLRLTRLEDGVSFSEADAVLARLLNNVTESSYLSMFFMSQQSCSDITSLAKILRQYTQNLPGSGSTSYSPALALKDLKRQKKELASQLSGLKPGALYQADEELSQIRIKIHCLTAMDSSDYAADEDYVAGKDYADNTEAEPPVNPTVSHFTHIGTIFIMLLFFIAGAFFFVCSLFSEIQITKSAYFLPSILCFGTGVLIFLLRLCLNAHKAPKSFTESEYAYESRNSDNDFYEIPDSENRYSSAELQFLLDREETLSQKAAVLEEKIAADQVLRQRMSGIQLAIDTISSLSADIHQTFSPDLQRTFARHASLLTGRPFSQILIDESFHFTLMEGNHLVPLEALSSGTISQLYFACRLASIQLLYPDTDLPLLLDDVFAFTDDTRLSVLLSRLSMDYPGQKLIFSCQKREAAILSQHSLSYHLIQL